MFISMGFLRSWTLTRQHILCLVLDRDEVSLSLEANPVRSWEGELGRVLDSRSLYILCVVFYKKKLEKELSCIPSTASHK